jgi:hypothetical protein
MKPITMRDIYAAPTFYGSGILAARAGVSLDLVQLRDGITGELRTPEDPFVQEVAAGYRDELERIAS